MTKNGFWKEHQVTVKLIFVGILTLILLIPTSWVESIVRDRQNMNFEVRREINEKWAGPQVMTGPILSIPLRIQVESDGEPTTEVRDWHILPQTLNMDGVLDPQQLRRGIYDVTVYQGDLAVMGHFLLPDPPIIEGLEEIRYDQARITIGLSDLRGIQEISPVQWLDQNIEPMPGSQIDPLIPTGITFPLTNATPDALGEFDFSLTLSLKGSEDFLVHPLGKTTTMHLTSSWSSPSFQGNFLPDTRTVSDEGFEADWKVLEINRNYPSQFVGSKMSHAVHGVRMGVKMLQSVDHYQKVMRTAKYSILMISLTFLIFFLVEVGSGIRIHPLQYTLVGLALCLFYVLLISFSEHMRFNWAYLVSVSGIVAMIVLYSFSIFGNRRYSWVLMGVLTGLYVYLFVTLNLEQYALLMGALGLFLILAATMYYTRRMDWYNNRGQ